ncbi:cupredoxin domain-containing protein [Candidatus Pacearchaeota archaeon]|nr:cupredoxin domain-containing protein [Candidatus Pacearchaeota archaeon]
MKTAYVFLGILVLALALGLVFLAGGDEKNPGSINGGVVSEDSNSENGNVVTFEVSGKNFRFFRDNLESPELKVKQGDRVRIVFTNEEGFHDFVIDEFAGARTKQIPAGSSETIEFAADKAGTFEYYCSVGKHRANGMFGKLIVE